MSLLRNPFNRGKGIAVISHEIVEFEARDLVVEVDTLIRRVDEILATFPADKVPYRAK